MAAVLAENPIRVDDTRSSTPVVTCAGGSYGDKYPVRLAGPRRRVPIGGLRLHPRELTGATSAAFNVTHGPLHHFLVEQAGDGAIGDQLAGTPFWEAISKFPEPW